MQKTIFSVPLFKFVVSGWPDKKQKILDSLPALDESYRSPAGDTYTDFFINQNRSKLPSYSKVVIDSISENLNDFESEYPKKVAISSMWFEKSLKSNYHGAHNHGSLGFSAVLFVEFDPLEHKATRLISPFSSFYSGGLMEHNPEGVNEGTLLIWPSIIIHDVEPNKSEKQRTIISFNIKGDTE